jgi:hypothetical protein
MNRAKPVVGEMVPKIARNSQKSCATLSAIKVGVSGRNQLNAAIRFASAAALVPNQVIVW